MQTFKDYLKKCDSNYKGYKSPSDCLEKKVRKRLNQRTYFGRWYGGVGGRTDTDSGDTGDTGNGTDSGTGDVGGSTGGTTGGATGGDGGGGGGE